MTKNDTLAELFGITVSAIKRAHKEWRPVDKIRTLFILSVKTH